MTTFVFSTGTKQGTHKQPDELGSVCLCLVERPLVFCDFK